MALHMLIGCAFLNTLAIWIVLGSPKATSVEIARRSILRERVQHIFVQQLTVLGSTPFVKSFSCWEPWDRSIEAFIRVPQVLAFGIGHEAAGSLLIFSCITACIMGFLLADGIGAVVLGVGMPVAIVAWGGHAKTAREHAIAHEVPDAFRSLSSAMGAGYTLAQAVSYVGSKRKGELSSEFRRAALSISCGTSAADALDELAERVRAPGVDLMVAALMVSAKTGAPLQGLFLRSARLAERRFELERELVAKTAQVRLSARIVCALPVGLVCLLALISPDFRKGATTFAGIACIVIALALDGVALIAIRKLMRGVL